MEGFFFFVAVKNYLSFSRCIFRRACVAHNLVVLIILSYNTSYSSIFSFTLNPTFVSYHNTGVGNGEVYICI